jgi:sterol desaturase/sphingolipid hydroxylase (fatty acid hydroxylase superfamily)
MGSPDPQHLLKIQGVVAVGVLAILWALETWLPLFAERPYRGRHALRNLAVAGMNLGVTSLLFSAATAAAVAWAAEHRFGLLRQVEAPLYVEVAAAVLLLDAWMYLWHRANHAAPLLWRFHRMHHSDPEVDVTTGLRFHPGEIAISSALRLAVVPLLGLDLWQLLLYETLLLPVIAFHHSSVALPERLDRVFRSAIVSPNMHRVHHSDRQPETDSNFSSIFSWWDRLFHTFRRREDVRALRYGLRDLEAPEHQTVPGMLRTPWLETTSPPCQPITPASAGRGTPPAVPPAAAPPSSAATRCGPPAA